MSADPESSNRTIPITSENLVFYNQPSLEAEPPTLAIVSDHRIWLGGTVTRLGTDVCIIFNNLATNRAQWLPPGEFAGLRGSTSSKAAAVARWKALNTLRDILTVEDRCLLLSKGRNRFVAYGLDPDLLIIDDRQIGTYSRTISRKPRADRQSEAALQGEESTIDEGEDIVEHEVEPGRATKRSEILEFYFRCHGQPVLYMPRLRKYAEQPVEHKALLAIGHGRGSIPDSVGMFAYVKALVNKGIHDEAKKYDDAAIIKLVKTLEEQGYVMQNGRGPELLPKANEILQQKPYSFRVPKRAGAKK